MKTLRAPYSSVSPGGRLSVLPEGHHESRKARLEKKWIPGFGSTGQQWMQTLDQFLTQTADGVFGIDDRHHIILWNTACERIFGLGSHSALGKPCWEVIGGEDRNGNPVCSSRCMVFTAGCRGRLVESFEMRILRGEEPVWVNVSTLFVQGFQTTIHLVRETCNPCRLEEHLQHLLVRLEKQLMTRKAHPAAKATPRLSPREMEVLVCLSDGQHAKDIAGQLGVSQSTIRTHIKTILWKLEVHSQLEAIAYAYKYKLL